MTDVAIVPVVATGNTYQIDGLSLKDYFTDNLANVAFTGNYTDISGRPTAVSSFSNDAGYITSATANVISVNGSTGTVTVEEYSNVKVANYLPTYSGNLSAGNVSFTGVTSIRSVSESIVNLTGATGTVNHDFALASIFNHTSIAGNFTVNMTNFTTTANTATNITVVLNQGVTPYIANAFSIGGSAQTIRWTGNIVPSGTASTRDVISFTVLNSSGTYTVLGQLVSFG
jgi:hypothetical protein